MREIKFRVFTRNQMIIFTLFSAVPALFTWRNLIIPELQNNEPLMQFIGLQDMNDVDLYDGDIVRATSYGESNIYQIKYMGDDGYPAFDLVPHVDCDCNAISHYEAIGTIEIIGNIYENPELLPSSNTR